MIGFLLFAVLVIAEIVGYIKADEEFDGLMMFGRPIVTFLGALFCGASFGKALLWGIAWGIIGFAIRMFFLERSDTREDHTSSEKPDPSTKVDPQLKTEIKKDPLHHTPEKPKQPTGPVYRDDIFEIKGTTLTRCKKQHDYIRIPHGVTVIQKNAFASHTGLRRVIFPDTLKVIEDGAFFNCVLLEELLLPEGVETIGEDAFSHCRSLKQILLPKSLKCVATGAFSDCTELTKVTFLDGCVADVERNNFSGCDNLRELTIPGTVNLIHCSLFPFFLGCSKKTVVRCYAGSSAYFEAKQFHLDCVLLDGKAYDASNDFVIEGGVLKSYTGKNPEVIIPEGTQAIQSKVFYGSSDIVSVVMPDSITTIGSSVFENCDKLRTVKLSKRLLTIPRRAFYNCRRLTEIVLPQGLLTIEQCAFADTGLGEVHLPEGIKSIHSSAFEFCGNLHTIHIPSSVQQLEGCLAYCDRAVIVAEAGSNAAQYAKRNGIPLRTPGTYTQPLRVPTSKDFPGNIYRTYYEILEPENKLAYSALVKSLLQMNDHCDFSGIPLEKVDRVHVADALEADYPEIFWVDWFKLSVNMFQKGGLAKAYSITKDQRDKMQQQIDALVKPFLASIPQHWGDYEKAKRAYEWLADKLEYDHTGLKEQNEHQYDSVTHDDLRNIYGAFVKKKVVCVGYALAYVYLLHAMGIEAVMRSGGNHIHSMHAWSCAKLEGDYYHFDITWGDSCTLSYYYFGLTDDEMYQTQKSLDLLVAHIPCNATRCSYYAKEWLYLDHVDAEDLSRRIRQFASEHRRDEIAIKFSNSVLLEQADACLTENGLLTALAKDLGFFMGYTSNDITHKLLKIYFK